MVIKNLDTVEQRCRADLIFKPRQIRLLIRKTQTCYLQLDSGDGTVAEMSITVFGRPLAGAYQIELPPETPVDKAFEQLQKALAKGALKSIDDPGVLELFTGKLPLKDVWYKLDDKGNPAVVQCLRGTAGKDLLNVTRQVPATTTGFLGLEVFLRQLCR